MGRHGHVAVCVTLQCAGTLAAVIYRSEDRAVSCCPGPLTLADKTGGFSLLVCLLSLHDDTEKV